MLDKTIKQQFEIIPNTLTFVPSIDKVYSAVLSPRLAISITLHPKLRSLSLQVLYGHSTTPATLKLRIPTWFNPATVISATTYWKPPTPWKDATPSSSATMILNFVRLTSFSTLALTAKKLVRFVFHLLKDNRLYIPPARWVNARSA